MMACIAVPYYFECLIFLSVFGKQLSSRSGKISRFNNNKRALMNTLEEKNPEVVQFVDQQDIIDKKARPEKHIRKIGNIKSTNN